MVQDIRVTSDNNPRGLSVAFDPSAKDGEYRLLSGWDDYSIRLYNVKATYDEKMDKELVHTFTGHKSKVNGERMHR